MGWRDWFRKRASVRQTIQDMDEVEFQDALVLMHLKKAGADLSKPREVTHYSYFPTESDARLVAEALSVQGYAVEVDSYFGEEKMHAKPWSVVATSNEITTSGTVAVARDFFNSLANSHRGEYDGWEAAVEPRVQ